MSPFINVMQQYSITYINDLQHSIVCANARRSDNMTKQQYIRWVLEIANQEYNGNMDVIL